VKIGLVADENGTELKEWAVKALKEFGIEYTDYSHEGDVAGVLHACGDEECDLVFGFSLYGQTLAAIANKMHGVIGHVIYTAAVAERAVEHGANFLSFSARDIPKGLFDVDQSIRSIIKGIANGSD